MFPKTLFNVCVGQTFSSLESLMAKPEAVEVHQDQVTSCLAGLGYSIKQVRQAVTDCLDQPSDVTCQVRLLVLLNHSINSVYAIWGFFFLFCQYIAKGQIKGL